MPPPKIVPFSATTVKMDRIITTISIIHNLGLMLYVIKLNYKSKELGSSNPARHKLWMVTLFCLTMTVLSVIDVLLLSTTLQGLGISCEALMMNRAFAYCLLRLSFWWYNLIRLDIVFYNTPLAYTKKFMQRCTQMLVIVTCFMIIFFVWSIFIGGGYVILVSPFNSCVANMKPPIAITVALLEAVTNVVLFWLFYNRIKAIASCTEDTDGTIMYQTRKYLVLIAVATLSTWSFVAFAVVTDLAFTIASIDAAINLWCLVLFDGRLDHIYQIMFRCCAKRQILDLETMQNTKNLEQSVASSMEAKKEDDHVANLALDLKVISETQDTQSKGSVNGKETESVGETKINVSTDLRNTLYASNSKATAVIR